MATPDLFDAYFRQADVDRDGRISGHEAVSFFQGANLQREVLAKIWQYADQGQTGFLSRAEFYNALKLVTVAQSGRELTPGLVAKALNGPAASQIPAPQIQFAASPMRGAAQTPGQVRPVRHVGPMVQLPNQYSAAGVPPVLQPTASMPSSRTPTLPAQVAPADWPTSKSSSWPGPASNNNLSSHGSQGGSTPGSNPTLAKTSPDADLFGGDVFTALPVKPQLAAASTQLKVLPQFTQVGPPTTQTALAEGLQTTPQQSLSSSAVLPTSSVPAAQSKQLQPAPTPAGQGGQSFTAALVPSVDGTRPWPKMTDAIVRRYTKIFFEVDTDKDGKISGIQARDLFLSWQLPREVLKQIWDLSDQDHDSMLSLREFCVALYLMERHREGRTLPAAISAAMYFDESGAQTLRISETQVAGALNSAGHNVPIWQQNPGGPGLPPRGILQGTAPGLLPRSMAQSAGLGLPPRPVPPGPSQGPSMFGQVPGQAPTPAPPLEPAGPPKSKAPVLEMELVNQLSADDQLTLQAKHQEAVDAEKKMHELETQIMDSKEKMEFYRTKMQEIVLFKTRCDNRLNEITERAAADKREVEVLTKRYNDKFKQAGESQSRLLADEAAFRDVQERRLELYNVILRMEQGGDSNTLLQSHAEKLETDLEELRKALNGKCKQLGLRIKPTTLVELPYGWQPGVQENAALWDEDWDKFDDEGFSYIQEFMEEGTARSTAAEPNSTAQWDDNELHEDGLDFSATDEAVHDVEERMPNGDHGHGLQEHSQDDPTTNGDTSSQEDTSSPRHTESSNLDAMDAKSKDSQSHDFGLSSWDDAFADDGGDWASAFSRRNDDTESTISWERNDGINTNTLEDSGFQSGKEGTTTAFGFSDPFDMLSNPVPGKSPQDLPSFGPIRTKEASSVFFDNSVPSTPLYNSASHGRVLGTGTFFDESVPSTPLNSSFSHGLTTATSPELFRFDSFSSTSNNDTTHPSDSFTRFDSFNTAMGIGQPRGFTSFDESDPFSGTGPFGAQATRSSTDASNTF